MDKDYILKPEEFKKLIDWDEPNGDGCFASNRITKDGSKEIYITKQDRLK